MTWQRPSRVNGLPTPRRPVPLPGRRLLASCWAGNEPAELLPVKWRELLITELHHLGWTDVEIATHTKLSSYTVARIRGRLGLSANKGAA